MFDPQAQEAESTAAQRGDLAGGKVSGDKIDLALKELQTADLSVDQISTLLSLARRFDVDSTLDSRANCVRSAGGIFIGQGELLRLGKIPEGTSIPPLPSKYSLEFLRSAHPIRDGSIAEHCILGFDPVFKEWICIDRGHGGPSDVLPGSTALAWDHQQDILKDIGERQPVCGVKLGLGLNHRSIYLVLESAIRLHQHEKKPIENLPFRNARARTLDIENQICHDERYLSDPKSAVIIGAVSLSELVVELRCYKEDLPELPSISIGVLAVWK